MGYRAAVRAGHMQLNRAAPLTGIEQRRHGAGIFSAGIQQHPAAARRDRIDAHFQAGIHALREGSARKRQPEAGRNSES